MAQNNFLPLYQKIANEFLNKIFNNELKPGDKIPTEFELMDIYKVSRITVVRALKELSNQGYITRTRKSGSMISKNMLDVLGDPPKFYKVLPLVMPISPISEFALFSSIEKAAQENGYLVSLYNTERDLNKERDVLNHLAATNIDGLICFPIESYSNLAVFARLINKKTPMVFIDHPLNGVDIPYVASDNRRGMHKMTKYLINNGH